MLTKILLVVLCVILGLLALVVLLLLPRTGFWVTLQNDRKTIAVRYGWLRKVVFQLPRKQKKSKKKPPKKPDDESDGTPKPKKKRKRGSRKELLQSLFDLLYALRRILEVDVLAVDACFASDDAATTALLLGSANAMTGAVTPFLMEYYPIRRYAVNFGADFTPKRTTYDDPPATQYHIELAFSTRPLHALYVIVRNWDDFANLLKARKERKAAE